MIFTLTDRNYNVIDAYESEDYLIGKYIGNIIQSLDLEVLITSENSEKWVEGNYIMCEDSDGYKYWFTIYIASDALRNSYKTLKCYSGTIDIVLEDANPIIKPDVSQPFNYYFEKIFYDTGIEIGINEISDLTRRLEFTSENATNAEMLQYVLNGFDNAEADLAVEFNGSIPIKLILNVFKRIGNHEPQSLLSDEDSSLTHLKRSGTISELATCLNPVGQNIGDTDTPVTLVGKYYEELDDGGNIIYYSPKESPRVFSVRAREQFYVQLPNKQNGEFDGYINRRYKSQASSQDSLWSQSLAQLKKIDNPSVEYEAKGYINCKIGDTIQIVSNEMKPPVMISARVLEYKFNDDDPSRNEYTFGNYQELESQMDQLAQIMAEIKKSIITVTNQITAYALSDDGVEPPVTGWSEEYTEPSVGKWLWTRIITSLSNGNETTAYSVSRIGEVTFTNDNPPVNPKESDKWYKETVDDTEYLIYIDGTWQPITSKAEIDNITENVENAISEAEAAKQVAEQSYADSVAEAERLVQVQTDAFNSQMSDVNDEISTVKTNIDTAISTVNQEIADNFTSLSDSISDVDDIATKAKADADQALLDLKSKASTAALEDGLALKVATDTYNTKVTELNSLIAAAQSKADTAAADLLKKADTTVVNAELAKKLATTTYNAKMTSLDTAISGHNTRIKATEDGLALTATKLEVDAVRTRMSEAETEISQNSDAIALKASQSSLDTTNGKLATAEATLVVQAGEIASKVSQTDFNALNGRVGTAETTISQQAGEIALKASQLDLDAATEDISDVKSSLTIQAGQIASKVSQTDFNALNGRVGTAETTISQQAGQIALKATKTELTTAIDGIEVGGRNLILNSSSNNVYPELAFNSTSGQVGLSRTFEDNFLQLSTTIASRTDNYYQFGSTSPEDSQGFENNVDYTFSMMMYLPSTNTNKSIPHVRFFGSVNGAWSANNVILPTVKKDEWIYVKFTGNFPSNSVGKFFRLNFSSDIVGDWFYIKNIKLEKGNKATDWSPAPEDVDKAISTVQSNLTVEAGKIASKVSQTDFNTLNGRVSTAETTITQQAGQIALKASQTSVDTLSGRVGTAETKISANTTAINLRATKSSVDTLTGRVTTAEGSITTQAGQIALKANTTTVNALTGRVSTAETNISANTSAINLRATKTELTDAIDGIEVGGRNILSGTEGPFEVIKTNTSGYYDAIIKNTINIPDGKEYILSFKAKASAPMTLRSHFYLPNTTTRIETSTGYVGYGGDGLANTEIGTEWDSYWIKWSQSETTTPKRVILARILDDFNNITLEMKEIKLEKGTKATDWTPAPEDVDASIASVQSNLTVEAGKITALTTRVSGTETNISNVTQTVSGHTSTISTLRTDVNGKATIVALNSVKSTADGNKTTISNHSGRLTTVETNVNGLQTTVSNKAEQSQVTQMANSLTSVITNLESLGGTNLLEGSNGSVESNLGYWSISGDANWLRNYHDFYKNSTEAVFMLSTSGTNEVTASSNTRVYVEPNTTYTFSMLGFMNVHVKSVDIHFLMRRKGETSSFTITNVVETGIRLSPSRLDSVTWTFTTPNFSDLESGYIRIDNNGSISEGQSAALYFTNIKLEKGAVATDYSESFTEKATQSQITQLSDSIDLRVTKGSLMSEINVQAGRTLISTNKLYLDTGSTIMTTAYVNDLKAKSLEAVTANITSIRSQVLVTDAVTSTHIKAENALIDTIFGTTALITRLTSKTAFIEDIKAKSLEAVNANITSIRSNILVTDAVESTHLKVDSALIDKLTVNTAMVDRFFAKEAVISNLSVRTLNAITANITSIRSKVLVTDTVTSTHIKAENALVDTIFGTTALITRLTSKTAFINNIKAISISADKVTTGTLDAAKVNITNLNVSKLVGNTSSFVQSAWNGISTRIGIDTTAITASDSAGNQAIINASGEIRSTAGGTDQTRGIFHKGRLWFHTTSGSAVLNIGAHPVVGEGVNRGAIATARAEKLVIGRYNDYLTTNINAKVNPYITLEYGATLGDESNAFTKVWHNLSMSGKFINDVQQVSGFELAVRATSGRLILGVTGYNTLQVGQANTRSFGNIEMQPGYEVTQASDRRWKDIVGKTETNALEEIKKLSVVDYYWKNGDGEKQFGLIAQDSPFLSVRNEDGYYGISGNKLAMLNLLSSQELCKRIEALEEEIKLLKSA